MSCIINQTKENEVIYSEKHLQTEVVFLINTLKSTFILIISIL